MFEFILVVLGILIILFAGDLIYDAVAAVFDNSL